MRAEAPPIRLGTLRAVTAANQHPLFRAAVLQLSCARSSAGQTAEVTDGANLPLAASDGRGAIRDSSGNELLRAPIALERRAERGTDTKLEVSDPAGIRLGEVRVTRYSFGPRSSKATLSLTADGAEVARLEPQDRKGEEVVITAGGAPVGTLRQTSRKRGLLRSSINYTVELTGDVEQRLRPLVIAAAIRYQALVAAAASASQRGD